MDSKNLKTIMDSKFLKADRKAVTEAVVKAAAEVARAFMEKKYEYFYEAIAELKDPEAFRFEVEREHAERHLKEELEDFCPLHDLFEGGHSIHGDKPFYEGVNAAVEQATEKTSDEPKGPKALAAAINAVKWNNLTEEGRSLFKLDRANRFADSARKYYVKQFDAYVEQVDGSMTISDIHEEVHSDAATLLSEDGETIHGEHCDCAFVLQHLKEPEAKRRCCA